VYERCLKRSASYGEFHFYPIHFASLSFFVKRSKTPDKL
jgi:hypothetical protein